MPKGIRSAQYLVLAIEDLLSYSEGRVSTSNKTKAVCRYISEKKLQEVMADGLLIIYSFQM